MLHYFAKDFYAPVIASSYVESGKFKLYVVSDLMKVLFVIYFLFSLRTGLPSKLFARVHGGGGGTGIPSWRAKKPGETLLAGSRVAAPSPYYSHK